MRHVTLTVMALAMVGIVACEDQAANRNPVGLDAEVAFGKQLGGQCDAARARAISTEQSNLWARPALAEATSRFDLVVASCLSNLTASRGYMLDYIQWTIDNQGLIISQGSGSWRRNLLAHWNTVFPYVGYTGADQPTNVDTLIFVPDSGNARVITQDTPDALREFRTPIAAMTVPVQPTGADLLPHLYVIYPLPAGCLTGTNLIQFGPCYEFGAFPQIINALNTVKVGICQPEGSTPLTGGLAHLSGSVVEIPDQQSYPTCIHPSASNDDGSWTGGFGSVMKRVAFVAGGVFGVKSAFAIHGGLGGLSPCCSPFGGANLEVFKETFAGQNLGTFIGPVAAETGTWDPITVKLPGSINIAASLGNVSDQLVVLNQGGGNCRKSCGGLLLQGNLATAGPAASNGIYQAEFVALQNQANMKEAVFVLRDQNGLDLARVTYAVRNNVKLILYNDRPASPGHPASVGTFLGNWVQGVSAHFLIEVDLEANTTTVWFNGASTAAVTSAFVDTAATTFSSISADFKGIDSGTIGWDNIIVRRMED